MGIIEEIDSSQDCPNGHPAHTECLKEWVVHSSTCPLCSEPYSKEVLEKFKGYIDQKEKEKQNALKSELQQEEIKKMEKVVEKMAFLKFLDSIDILIDEKEYDYAISRLELHNSNDITNNSGRDILFLKGKINFLRGRYDLAINQLFKLVKEQYDYPEGFLYLGKSYEALGLTDKAKWAFERVK